MANGTWRSAGGTSGLVPVASLDLSADATDLDFTTGVDGDAHGIYKLVADWTNGAGAAAYCRLKLNNTNVDEENYTYFAPAVGPAISGGRIVDSQAVGKKCSLEMTLYVRSGQIRQGHWTGNGSYSTGATLQYSGEWTYNTTTGNITRITLAGSAANFFASGAKGRLFKVVGS